MFEFLGNWKVNVFGNIFHQKNVINKRIIGREKEDTSFGRAGNQISWGIGRNSED